ncbi:hypothetical protein PIIN_07978 [Serendipita indica DSM 11827]|uniref:Uncharacterized protein n=1 Tax=Serendipita indica (strain DSM 11827) TaxID=1109443 RepID=G4TRT1_SERID|nr:hypothetical protein PIIN_07978 [Serendipita indica DSM 11827]
MFSSPVGIAIEPTIREREKSTSCDCHHLTLRVALNVIFMLYGSGLDFSATLNPDVHLSRVVKPSEDGHE